MDNLLNAEHLKKHEYVFQMRTIFDILKLFQKYTHVRNSNNGFWRFWTFLYLWSSEMNQNVIGGSGRDSNAAEGARRAPAD